MGRTVRRVPAGFNWPVNKTWDGFVKPEWLRQEQCPDCETGYSPEAEKLHKTWYGNSYFRPEDNGSVRYSPQHPVIQHMAERNMIYVQNTGAVHLSNPETFNQHVQVEAERLAEVFNSAWSYHLSQEDVDVLVEAGELHELTHEFVRGEGWVPKTPAPSLTAEAVNEALLTSLSGSSTCAYVCIQARCNKAGVPVLCGTCDGTGFVEKFVGQKAAADSWEPVPVPTGEWWQIWETVSEGSPITPAFETPEELAHYYVADSEGNYDNVLDWVVNDGWVASMYGFKDTVKTGDDIILGI